MRTLADELANPKYSHIERERRWLATAAADALLDGAECVHIEDRYVTGTRLRLRCMTYASSGERSLKLTKKYACGDVLDRPMVTVYLDDDEYALFQTLPAARLAKRRYTVRHGGAEWSIDCFEGPLGSLRTIEQEAPTEAALRAMEAPAWAGNEVTGDVRYKGGMLALHGLPETN